MKQPPVDLAERLVASSDLILGADARIDDVAEAVGVARTTLYYYFSGRDDLVGFLLAEHVRAGAEAIDAARLGPGSPAVRLRAVVAALVGFLGSHSGLCSGLLASMGITGRMDEVLATNERHVVTPVRDLIMAGVEAGEIRPADPTDMANALLGGALMTVLGRVRRGAGISAEDAEGIAGLLVGGLLVDADDSPA